MKKLNLEIEGALCKGFVQKIKGELWVHFQGKTYCYKPVDEYGAGAGAVALDPSQIKAPMPGKIIKINRAIGADVSKGDILVVMEAMKMEYNLKVAGDGKIENIQCKEGEQVGLGQVLIKLEVDNG